MPLITVKVFEGELTQQQTADIIQGITEAVIPFVGKRLREATWVLVEEVKSGAWGIGASHSVFRSCGPYRPADRLEISNETDTGAGRCDPVRATAVWHSASVGLHRSDNMNARAIQTGRPSASWI